MTTGAFGSTPFSAVVDLWLDCGQDRLPLSQVGQSFIIAQSPRDLPAGTIGTVVVSVDGREHRRHVRLIEGMAETDPEAAVVPDQVPF